MENNEEHQTKADSESKTYLCKCDIKINYPKKEIDDETDQKKKRLSDVMDSIIRCFNRVVMLIYIGAIIVESLTVIQG